MSRTILFICGICMVLIAFITPTEAKEKKKVVRYPAEFTGYYPDDSLMEGGYQAANTEWLDPSDWTCAAPKCIPFDTMIKVGGTGNWRDGHSYRVNDRGGAIVVDEDGVFHIDILMSCKEQADNFGRVQGWIEVVE